MKRLTPRQTEVLRWLACGKTPKETAGVLGVTPRTVFYHLYRAMRKLQCRTTTQAVVMLIEMDARKRITELEMEVLRLRSVVHRKDKGESKWQKVSCSNTLCCSTPNLPRIQRETIPLPKVR